MPSDRVDWLLTVVEQQQQRLSILEGLVEHLCTQILCKPTPLPPTKPSTNQDQLPPPILATSGEGANYSESINLSESLKRLTSQLESKLRASGRIIMRCSRQLNELHELWVWRLLNLKRLVKHQGLTHRQLK